MIRLMIFIALISVGYSKLCYAFEVDGFRTEMSMEEALLIARKTNLSARSFNSAAGITHVMIRKKLGKSAEIKWNVMFCHNRLVELTKHYPFSLPEAANVISRMNKQYGQGSVSPLISSLNDLSSFGIRGGVSNIGIELFWKNEIESVSVTIKLRKFDGEGAERMPQTKRKEVMSEYYGKFNDGCIDEN